MDYSYNAYEILGLPETASDEELEARYKELRAQFQRDRFLPGEEGEDASEKLQRLEVAYRDIVASREEAKQGCATNENTCGANSEGFGEDFSDVQQLIKENKLDEAQKRLDARETQNAEWHYVQSILFYKRNWFLESKKQLELACQMDPGNARYRQSLEKLTKILASNTISPDQMRTTSRPADDGPHIGAGNGTCTGSSCGDCLLCNLCCNCASCMGGGC